jgi:hypothetical protein
LKNGEQTRNMMDGGAHMVVFSENPMVMVALNHIIGI